MSLTPSITKNDAPAVSMASGHLIRMRPCLWKFFENPLVFKAGILQKSILLLPLLV